MIKDLDEAMYYCSIVKAMEDSDEEKKYQRHMSSSMYYPEHERDMDKGSGRMYYPMHSPNHLEYEMDTAEWRDSREGRSPMIRKTYMEGRQKHQSKEVQMKELEKYMQELSQDIIDMIQEASPEEKQLLQQKITTLAAKIK
jgi:hypothetical protein